MRVALVVELVVVDLGQVPVLDLDPGGPGGGGMVGGGWWLAPVLASWPLVVIWVLGEILGIGWWDPL